MINSIEEFRELAHRFLVGKFKKPYEWDDFISVEHKNELIERYRVELGAYEPLLFSKNKNDYEKYRSIVMEIIKNLDKNR